MSEIADYAISRRRLLTGVGVLALGALTGCGFENASPVYPSSDAVRRAEQRRRGLVPASAPSSSPPA